LEFVAHTMVFFLIQQLYSAEKCFGIGFWIFHATPVAIACHFRCLAKPCTIHAIVAYWILGVCALHIINPGWSYTQMVKDCFPRIMALVLNGSMTVTVAQNFFHGCVMIIVYGVSRQTAVNLWDVAQSELNVFFWLNALAYILYSARHSDAGVPRVAHSVVGL